MESISRLEYWNVGKLDYCKKLVPLPFDLAQGLERRQKSRRFHSSTIPSFLDEIMEEVI